MTWWLIPIAIVALGFFVIHKIYPEASVIALVIGFVVALLSLIPLAVVVCLLTLALGGGDAVMYGAGALGIVVSILIWIAIARRSNRKQRDNSTNS